MLRPPIREIEAFLCSIFYDLSLHVKCSHARIYGCCAQLLFDAEKLIVLCNTLGSGRCAGLDLAGVQCDCQICNRCILSLAGAVGRDRSIACLMCHFDRFKCLGHGTDLVQLDQDGIATAKGDTFCKALCIRYKQIIADELYLITKLCSELLPALPVLFVECIFDRNDRDIFLQASSSVRSAHQRCRPYLPSAAYTLRPCRPSTLRKQRP